MACPVDRSARPRSPEHRGTRCNRSVAWSGWESFPGPTGRATVTARTARACAMTAATPRETVDGAARDAAGLRDRAPRGDRAAAAPRCAGTGPLFEGELPCEGGLSDMRVWRRVVCWCCAANRPKSRSSRVGRSSGNKAWPPPAGNRDAVSLSNRRRHETEDIASRHRRCSVHRVRGLRELRGLRCLHLVHGTVVSRPMVSQMRHRASQAHRAGLGPSVHAASIAAPRRRPRPSPPKRPWHRRRLCTAALNDGTTQGSEVGSVAMLFFLAGLERSR